MPYKTRESEIAHKTGKKCSTHGEYITHHSNRDNRQYIGITADIHHTDPQIRSFMTTPSNTVSALNLKYYANQP